VLCRRDEGTKISIKIDDILSTINGLLDDISVNLYNKVKQKMYSHYFKIDDYNEFEKKIDGNFILSPFCCDKDCETKFCLDMKQICNIKSLCIPFEQTEIENKKCINCDKKALKYVIFSKSY